MPLVFNHWTMTKVPGLPHHMPWTQSPRGAGQHVLLPLCQCRVLHGILPWHLLTRHNLGILPAKQIGATLLQSPAPTQHKRFSNSLNHWSSMCLNCWLFQKLAIRIPKPFTLLTTVEVASLTSQIYANLVAKRQISRDQNISSTFH